MDIIQQAKEDIKSYRQIAKDLLKMSKDFNKMAKASEKRLAKWEAKE